MMAGNQGMLGQGIYANNQQASSGAGGNGHLNMGYM